MWGLLIVALAVALIAQTRSKNRIRRELGYRDSEAAYLQDLLFEEKVKSNRLKGEVKKYNLLGEGAPFRAISLPLPEAPTRALPAGTEPPPPAPGSPEEERRRALSELTARWEEADGRFEELTRLYTAAVAGTPPCTDLDLLLSLMAHVHAEFDQISKALEEVTKPGRDSIVEGGTPTLVRSRDGLDL